jgi:hypothetical protein
MRIKTISQIQSLTWLSPMLLACGVSLAYAANQPKFTSIDFPGAINTQATAITPSGDIVGRYLSADGMLHGFFLRGGTFHSIDFPSATSTDVTWINPLGQIVGLYYDTDGKSHGYLLTQGQFTPIDYPGARETAAYGIGAAGDIVGIEIDQVGTIHGFLLNGSNFTSIDFPGAAGTLPTMIANGRITGGYWDGTNTHGFELQGSRFHTIDCPGAPSTFLSGIDPQGQMVGGYTSSDGNQHGALVINGNCTTVDIPGSTGNYANGIDPQGDIVGRYTGADGIVHGYLLSRIVKSANVVYSAAHDFSFTSNPNAVWSYGFATNVGGPFALDSISGSTFFSGEAGWFGPLPGATAPGYPLVTAQQGVIPNVLDMGPGPSSYSVVRWTAPSRGSWDVVGQFFGTGFTTGDVHVLHNGTPVFDSSLNGFQVAAFSLVIRVFPGDTIDFAAGPGPGGNNDFDPTGFNVTITPKL